MPDYAAESPSAGTHWIGAATSTNPIGPFTTQSEPIACRTAGGGTIDPAGFQDADGTVYVVYKVDGNNLGGGAYSTPIILQKIESDGVTPTGNPVQILDRGTADSPLIKALDLVLHDGI